MALSQGVQKKYQLWTKAGRAEVEQLPLLPYAAERRKQLLQSLDGLEAEIRELDRGGGRSAAAAGGGAADDASGSRSGNRLSHGADLGTGRPIRIGPASGQLLRPDSQRRFQRRKTAAGQDQQTGQFVSALFAGGSGTDRGAVGSAAERFYRRLAARKNRSVAKVAVARKLATRLYLMLREDWTYTQLCQAVMQVSPSHSVAGQ